MTSLMILKTILAIAAGGAIGYGFGLMQQNAQRKNEQKMQAGKLNSGWAVMPGSMRRIVNLVLLLVIVQVICPFLFNDATQWYVSGGVAAGYGIILYKQLRERQSRMA